MRQNKRSSPQLHVDENKQISRNFFYVEDEYFEKVALCDKICSFFGENFEHYRLTGN